MKGNFGVKSEQSSSATKKVNPIERRLSLVEVSIKSMQAADDAVALHATQMRSFIDGLVAADRG